MSTPRARDHNDTSGVAIFRCSFRLTALREFASGPSDWITSIKGKKYAHHLVLLTPPFFCKEPKCASVSTYRCRIRRLAWSTSNYN
ncbi:hypothetical protein ABKN59_001371 [Abortiporus biennis]